MLLAHFIILSPEALRKNELKDILIDPQRII